MTERLTKERINELLEEIKIVEQQLETVDGNGIDTSEVWTNLIISRAKLQALKGEYK